MGAFRPTVLRVGFFVGLLFGLLPLIGAQAASGGTWSTTGSMNQGRESFAAALLADGRVLVAGGFDGTQGALASAEIYDPSTGKWTTTGSMNEGREFFTATRLQDGKVLVAGGTTGPVDSLHDTDSTELYDPSTGKWTTTGSLSGSRSDHTATLLPNGKVLVAGGTSGKSYLKSAELYDPSSGKWTSAGDMKSGRYSHTATLLQNGKVLVAAGSSASDGTPLSTADIYDPGSNSWTAAKPLNIARRGHAAALLQNGKVLVAGGITCPKYTPAYTATAELYDPSSDSWSYAGYMTMQRSAPTATLLQNGKVLVAGGVTGKAENTNSAELFDPTTGTWTATGSMADKRFAHTATLLSDGRVLIAGGSNGYVNNVAQELTSAELYGSVVSSSLAVNAATGNYGGTTTLSATLTANGSPIAGKNIRFTLNGHDAGSATTDGSGVATLKDVSLTGLSVASYPITASFAGDADYGASSGSSTLTIDKAEPAITWDNPADITYGTPLGDTQLNAIASVPGSFTYTPAAGTVLEAGASQTLKVDFTPTDTTNYTTASKQVQITVLKADLTVTAGDASKVLGAPNPTLTGTITGIQNNDHISATLQHDGDRQQSCRQLPDRARAGRSGRPAGQLQRHDQ